MLWDDLLYIGPCQAKWYCHLYTSVVTAASEANKSNWNQPARNSRLTGAVFPNCWWWNVMWIDSKARSGYSKAFKHWIWHFSPGGVVSVSKINVVWNIKKASHFMSWILDAQSWESLVKALFILWMFWATTKAGGEYAWTINEPHRPKEMPSRILPPSTSVTVLIWGLLVVKSSCVKILLTVRRYYVKLQCYRHTEQRTTDIYIYIYI